MGIEELDLGILVEAFDKLFLHVRLVLQLLDVAVDEAHFDAVLLLNRADSIVQILLLHSVQAHDAIGELTWLESVSFHNCLLNIKILILYL